MYRLKMPMPLPGLHTAFPALHIFWDIPMLYQGNYKSVTVSHWMVAVSFVINTRCNAISRVDGAIMSLHSLVIHSLKREKPHQLLKRGGCT